MVIPIVGLVWNGVEERSGVNFAGFRPRTARGNALRGFAPARFLRSRSFCFGKRIQNHGRPGAALRVPLPQSRMVRAAELASLKQSSPSKKIRDCGAAAPAGALDLAPFDGAVFSLLSSPTRSGIQGLCFFLSLRRERRWILACARMTEKEMTEGRSRAWRRPGFGGMHPPFCHPPTRSGIQGLCFFLSLRRERRWILACARMTEKEMTEGRSRTRRRPGLAACMALFFPSVIPDSIGDPRSLLLPVFAKRTTLDPRRLTGSIL